MKPVTFTCTQVVPQSAPSICAEIADTARWPEFSGYGILPGIAVAAYDVRTPELVGSRIRVGNTDGSGHVEEILVWQDGQRIVMKLHEFTPPVSRMATHFMETWEFQPRGDGTLVSRRLDLHPTHGVMRPPLWAISLLLRRAIAAHLMQMARGR